MNKFVVKLVKTCKFLRGFFPKKLPTGLADFNQFSADIIDVYGLPNLPSYKHAIASMIMHLSPTTFYKSPWFFAISVKKAMANQTAYEIMQLLKEAEKEKQHQGEDTPDKALAQDEPSPNAGVQETSEDLVSKA